MTGSSSSAITSMSYDEELASLPEQRRCRKKGERKKIMGRNKNNNKKKKIKWEEIKIR